MTVYECDICKKRVKQVYGCAILKITNPPRTSTMVETADVVVKSGKMLELCEDCYNKMYNLFEECEQNGKFLEAPVPSSRRSLFKR